MVSVIVPVYNVEKYVEQCVKSILCQTYRDLEVILVDDGSTDSSGEICESFAGQDARVKVVHQENRGISAARNIGMTKAVGEYIMQVDSDDFIEPNMCQILLEALTETGAAMAVCNCTELIDRTGEEHAVRLIKKRELVTGEEMLGRLNEKDMKYYVLMSNRMYKAELLRNISFPVGRINEDLARAHEIYHKAGKIILLPDALYHYRLRSNSITTQKLSVKNLDAVEAFYGRFLYYQENNLEQFLPGTVRWARELMEIRVYLDVKSAEERKRVKQIDAMFRYMYFSKYSEKSWKNTLVALCPSIYFGLKKKFRKKSVEK